MAVKKLTQSQWDKLHKRLLKGESQHSLSKEYGVARSTIRSRFSALDEKIKNVARIAVNAEINKRKMMMELAAERLNNIAPTFLYIITAIEFNGIYKIGVSSDVNKRIIQMQTGCPYTLNLVSCYSVDKAYLVENMLHVFFQKKRTCGEWFRLEPLDLEYIDSVFKV